MKIKMLLTVMVIFALLGGVVGGGYYSLLLPQPSKESPASAVEDNLFGWKFPVTKFPVTGKNGELIAYSDIRDPGGIPQGLPVRLKIPVIGVDSVIEDALITPDGRMDVPEGSVNVAWFSLGPQPGKVGSSVIGGHFGISNGVPWVFYDLDKLRSGDKIYIEDDKGNTLAFIVRSTKSFDRNADATTVFTSSDGLAHLNLITCEGIWNQTNGTYPTRLVVFTDAIPSEGEVEVTKAKSVTEATSKLPITGLTIMPTSSPNELTGTSSSSKKLSFSPSILIQSIQSLYATPMDGLITSVLLLAVGFIVFKIIRRR